MGILNGNLIGEYGVYSISHQGKLLYIGSSNSFKVRIKSHLKKLKDQNHQKNLQKYVNENEKDLNELEFKIIHRTQDESKIRLFFSEMICILYYHPLCNKAVYQVGLKYISWGMPLVSFDIEILKYI